MEPTTLLITGGNSGLGLATVKVLVQSTQPYHIILAARSIEKAEQAKKQICDEFSTAVITPLELDLGNDESINAAAVGVTAKFDHLDVLVNNAGVSYDRFIADGSMSKREAWNASWDTNVVGTHLTTEAFTPLLLKSKEPRLLFLTSGLASCGETIGSDAKPNQPPEAGWPKAPEASAVDSYRTSKVGLNMLMRTWERLLRKDGVKVFAVAPGRLATGLVGSRSQMQQGGALEPEVGGQALRKVIEGGRDHDGVGMIVREYGTPIQSW